MKFPSFTYLNFKSLVLLNSQPLEITFQISFSKSWISRYIQIPYVNQIYNYIQIKTIRFMSLFLFRYIALYIL